MANSLQRLVVGGKDIRFAPNGQTRFDAGITVRGFWLFNQAPGESAGDTRRRCAWNRAPGARNAPEDRVIIGAPTPFSNYWRFTSADALRTQFAELTDTTILVIARSQYATLGSTTAERAHMAGFFGNTQNRGTSLVFNTMSVVRGLTYQNPGTPALAPVADLTMPSNTLDKWRIYRLWTSTSAIRLKNISGDSTTNEPSSISLPDDKVNGLQNFSIGARLENGVPSASYTAHCDIAGVVLLSGAVGSGADETALSVRLRNQMQLAGLTELSA